MARGSICCLSKHVEPVLFDDLQQLPRHKPIRMIIAGGAAMHLYTGVRVSKDVDAVFSHRIALPENLSVAYWGADGRAQVLYFDYQYSDTLGLLHEDAHDDAVHMTLPGINAKVLDVRLLAPVDLAISVWRHW
jgi:hypothetical protein